MTTRFQDRKQYLWTMSQRVLVECPHCRSRAIVLRKGPSFTCGSCGYNQRGTGEGWAGMAKATVKRKCGRCGRILAKTVRRAAPHPCKLGVTCPGCSYTNYIPVIWRPDPKNEPCDPHFGYRLWLQTRCVGEILWAYNEEHLAFLRGYVGADLREREPNANATLASRLPKWLQSAKNRDGVLRAVRRLEAKLAS